MKRPDAGNYSFIQIVSLNLINCFAFILRIILKKIFYKILSMIFQGKDYLIVKMDLRLSNLKFQM
ncbi:MAG: hypothetical protein A2W11_03445 [Ignavibacteria bacterium RBG_16_35_7]|nr:MAG: hypothetical protein A2W11_03445 [Ignavibacteria bacterium RBG_16_35_7]